MSIKAIFPFNTRGEPLQFLSYRPNRPTEKNSKQNFLAHYGQCFGRNSVVKTGLRCWERSAHSDWVLRSLDDPKLNKSSARFHDLVLSMKIALARKTKCWPPPTTANQFSITSDSLYHYTNTAAAINWKHQFNERTALVWCWATAITHFHSVRRRCEQ